jgi:glucosamine--fructose-6-phosphate aminotransferase (isomerizing)
VSTSIFLDEMWEQPRVLADLIKRWDSDITDISARLPKNIQGVLFVGRGSSDNAGIIGRYAVEAFAGIPATLAAPSLSTRYPLRASYDNYLIVAMSQSGNTPEIISTASALRGEGSMIIAITNSPDNPLSRIADLNLDLGAGPEKAVPASKTVTAQVLQVLKIAVALAKARGINSPISDSELMALPNAVREVLGDLASVDQIAKECLGFNRLQIITRGLVYGAALEVAIKIKEITGVFAHGISSADFVHGPIAGVNQEVPAIIFDAGGVNSKELSDLNLKLKQMGITTYISSTDKNSAMPLPTALSEVMNSIPIIIRGQQLSYLWALLLGKSADSPAGLSKITQTY